MSRELIPIVYRLIYVLNTKEITMKKIIFMLLAAVLIVGAFAACTPQRGQDELPPDENPDKEPQTQELKAVILKADENSLFVKPIEGLEDIEEIYLNYTDETKINVSDGAPLEPGTIVYAVIDTAIMESFPPQVVLYEITKTEIDPEFSAEPDTGESMPAPENYMTGKVVGIDGDKYEVEVLGSSMVEGRITLTIPADVLDDDMPIEEGNLIGVYIAVDGDKVTAEKIVFSEPDQIIQLDDRETISGYLNGMFPQVVYYMGDENLQAEAGNPFAIGLEENCESGWSLEEQEGVKLVANGKSQPGEDGNYINYFGIQIDKAGTYTLKFIHETAEGTFDFSFDVTVK